MNLLSLLATFPILAASLTTALLVTTVQPSSRGYLAKATSRFHRQYSLITLSATTLEDVGIKGGQMPELGKDGIHQVMNEEEYRALLDNAKDKLVVLKVFAPWCKACKSLAPRFIQLSREPKYLNLPIIWAEVTCKDNKDLIKSMQVKQIPTVQLYAHSEVQSTFPCKPTRLPALKKLLAEFIDQHVDPNTLQVKNVVTFPDSEFESEFSMEEEELAPPQPQEDSSWVLEIHQPEDTSNKPTFTLELHLTSDFLKKLNLGGMYEQVVRRDD